MLNRRTFGKTILGGAVCAALSAGIWPVNAWAHRQKQAMSTITWNPTTKLLEITHDLHAHDAEQVLAHLGQINAPNLTSLRARALLALYIQKNFEIATVDGQKIDLAIIGAETDTTYAHVYMEAKMSAPPTGLLITNRIFQDVFADQINQVNMSFGDNVRSIIFAAGDGQKKLLA